MAATTMLGGFGTLQAPRSAVAMPANRAAASSSVALGAERFARQAVAAPQGSTFLGGPIRHVPTARPAVSRGASKAGVVLASECVEAGFDEMASGSDRKYFMLGGKGGVGKTSLAASLAVKFANSGHQTLVVSTDPAHSLSDSLAQDVSGGAPIRVEGTDTPLYAMEIDPEKAKEEFYEKMKRPDTKNAMRDFLGGVGLGGLADQVAELNLAELLDTPPPGLDEAIAIAKVVEFVDGEEFAKFSRIVFDTAPTGHTLRMLALPEFLDASVGKIMRLRKKVLSAGSAVKSLFGIEEGEDETEKKLNELRDKVVTVRNLLKDEKQMEFIIATIPTAMAASESTRLLKSLRGEGVPCRRIVVNQCVPEGSGDKFYDLKRKDQDKALSVADADAGLKSLRRVTAPLFDLEVRGVPALQFFGGQVWGSEGSGFDEINAASGRQYIMLGGKGGVGKTSLSASLAVKLAMEGHKTLVVSTDPAHSLSDSLSQDVSGGAPVPVTEGGAGIPLYGMQVDAAAARDELKQFAEGGGGQDILDKAAGLGLGAIVDQIKDLKLGELMDTPPPGVDEAVAIARVVEMVESEEYQDFTRVVFDTAPTGHTLRLLTLPDFVEATIGKVVRLRAMLSGASSMVSQLFGGKESEDEQLAKLEELKRRVNQAKDLFRNKDSTQFVIVTIPTVMAMSESGRLLAALRKEGVPCNAMVVNQVLREDGSSKEGFLGRKFKDQERAMAIIEGE